MVSNKTKSSNCHFQPLTNNEEATGRRRVEGMPVFLSNEKYDAAKSTMILQIQDQEFWTGDCIQVCLVFRGISASFLILIRKLLC